MQALRRTAEDANSDPTALRTLLLDTDLQQVCFSVSLLTKAVTSLKSSIMGAIHAVMLQIGKASLPDDINRTDSKQLKGPHVLQVTAIEDVSTPSKGATSASKQR